jgi:hypothetical protein
MKNKTCSIALAGALLLCSAIANANDHCKGPDKFDLTVKKYHLDLNEHKPVCVTVPGTVLIHIKNPSGGGHDVNAGEVSVRQKEPGNPDVQISGDNSDDEEYLKITINGTASVNDEFRFLITVKHVGVLDPRVRVVPSSEVDALFQQSVQQHFYELQAIAKTYGVGVDEAFKILREAQGE